VMDGAMVVAITRVVIVTPTGHHAEIATIGVIAVRVGTAASVRRAAVVAVAAAVIAIVTGAVTRIGASVRPVPVTRMIAVRARGVVVKAIAATSTRAMVIATRPIDRRSPTVRTTRLPVRSTRRRRWRPDRRKRVSGVRSDQIVAASGRPVETVRIAPVTASRDVADVAGVVVDAAAVAVRETARSPITEAARLAAEIASTRSSRQALRDMESVAAS
ncbi:MAG: hypothetical protein ACRETD_11450, partial [Steroidobacteraceae bacterium]